MINFCGKEYSEEEMNAFIGMCETTGWKQYMQLMLETHGAEVEQACNVGKPQPERDAACGAKQNVEFTLSFERDCRNAILPENL